MINEVENGNWFAWSPKLIKLKRKLILTDKKYLYPTVFWIPH